MTTTCDAFLGGRLRLLQPAGGFRSGSDAVLLAACVPARSGQRVLDLGCGTGAAMYCLGARVPDLVLTGVEQDAEAAALARRNGSAEVAEADVLTLPPDLRNRQWDHVLTNPPYFVAGSGSSSGSTLRENGLRERAPGDLSRWLVQACKRVAPKGTLSVIVRADRLADALAPMSDALGGLRVLPISAKDDAPAKRIILQGVRGARAPLALLPPLVLHRTDGEAGYRAEADMILREMAPILLR